MGEEIGFITLHRTAFSQNKYFFAILILRHIPEVNTSISICCELTPSQKNTIPNNPALPPVVNDRLLNEALISNIKMR